MVKRYALDSRQGEMFEIASGYYVAHDDYATLEAENAKLRDLLRRVRGCFRNGETPASIAIELSTLMPEIKSAIEPSGDGGEEHPKDMLADIDQEELRP